MRILMFLELTVFCIHSGGVKTNFSMGERPENPKNNIIRVSRALDLSDFSIEIEFSVARIVIE